MNAELRAKLASLPRLGANSTGLPRCKVCGSSTEVFDAVDFNKFCNPGGNPYAFGVAGIEVVYYVCQSCSFVFTDFFDEWPKDEFSRFVYNDDYIKVDGAYASVRPEQEAAAMMRRLRGLAGLRILDYGAGSGVFADRLAALGIAGVENYDPFSSPERPDRRFDVLTCFEVLEHAASPAATLADMKSFLAEGGCIVFSTGIQPRNIGELRGSWWYVAPRNGHVSIYSIDALALLGQSVGLTLYTGDGGLAFAAPDPSGPSQTILASIGRPFRFLVLTAPEPAHGSQREPTGRDAEWNGVEGVTWNRFRWTRRQEVHWQIEPPSIGPCRLKLAIPFKMEVEAGFADQCQLGIDRKLVRLSRQGKRLVVDIDVEELRAATLLTPMPRRPSELRQAPDNRSLGLAIPLASGLPSPKL